MGILRIALVGCLSSGCAWGQSLSASPSPITYGDSVTLTLDGLPASTRGETAYFYANDSGFSVLLGTATVALASKTDGRAVAQVSGLSGGNHFLLAYCCNNGTNGSYGANTTLTVNRTSSSVTLSSSTNPSAVGQSFTLTANVSASNATGTVSFYPSGSEVEYGRATISNGTATFTISLSPAGTYALSATYNGDANYNPSTSSSISQTAKNPTSVSVSTSPNPSTINGSVTIRASVSPSSASGQVTFFDGGNSLGTTGVSAGSASIATSSLGVGTHSLTASYSGDSNNISSSSSTYSHTVNKNPTTTSLSTPPNPPTQGQPVTLTATVSPSSATGPVTLSDGGNPIGTANLSNGTASFTTSLGAGTHILTASYGGDSNYIGSSNSVSIPVNKNDTTTNLGSSANPANPGQTVTFTANVSPNGATVSVTFSEGNNTLATVNLSGGTATYATASLSVGSHTVKASYNGDGNYNGSSGTVNQVINQPGKASTTTSLASSPNPSVAGQSVTLTASVSPAAATGSVTFSDGNTALATVNLVGGSASFSTSSLSTGTHSLSASYSGDGNYDGSSGSVSQPVNPKSKTDTSINFSATPNPSVAGQPVTLAATVSPADATGSITFSDGSGTLGSVNLSGATSTFITSGLSTGSHSLTASYSGDSNYNASTSQGVTQNVQTSGQLGITTLIPSTAAAGSSGFTLTINGTGFGPGATAQWNGVALGTNFVSATQLTAVVPASLIASIGSAAVTVTSGGSMGAALPFTVNTPGQSCVFSFSPVNASFGAAGGPGSIAVTASRSDCIWTASTNAAWISFTNSTLTGSGSLNYTVAPSAAGTSRTASIGIGLQSFNVNQGGTNCTFTLPRAVQAFGPGGGTGTVTVKAPAGCTWAATGTSAAITLSESGGSGDGTVSFTVSANTQSQPVSYVLSVAGLPFTVTEEASSSTLNCTASVPGPLAVALEGRTEILGDLVVSCAGLSGPIIANVTLALNVNVTNSLNGGMTDAVLSVNGGAAINAATFGYNGLRWNSVTIVPAGGGTATLRISHVRADASELSINGIAGSQPISGQVSIQTASGPIPVAAAQQTLATAMASLVTSRIQATPPTGGPQTTIPLRYQEGRAAAFTANATRLRVSLANIPVTVQVYAPVFPVEGSTRAQLYSADANGWSGAPVDGSLMASARYQQLTVTNGMASATWLVLAADASQVETWTFPLLVLNAVTADLNAMQVASTLGPVSDVSLASAAAPVPRYHDLSVPQKLVNLRVTSFVQASSTNAPIQAPASKAPLAAAAGSHVTFVTQIVNDTSDPSQSATGVTVQNNLGAGLTLVSCSAQGATCSGSGNQVQLNIGSLGAGQSVSATVVAQVDSSVPGGTVIEDDSGASSDEVNQDPGAGTASTSVIVLSGSPVVVGGTPPSGTGTNQSFTFQFSDPAGYQSLGVVNVLINSALDGRSACYLAYSVQSNTLYLVGDSGQAQGPYAGALGLGNTSTIQNSQCAVKLTSAIGSGSVLTLVLNISFTPSFSGNKIVFVAARDMGTGNSSWQPLGVWQNPLTSPGAITVAGVDPARSSKPGGQSQQYTFTFTDIKGSGDFGVLNVLINNSIDGRKACYLAYSTTTRMLYLIDDQGDAGGPFAGTMPLNGGSNGVSNSQCAVNGAGSAVSVSANTLTLTLNLTFTEAFAGNRVIWAAARDHSDGNNTGWQSMGTVTVQ